MDSRPIPTKTAHSSFSNWRGNRTGTTMFGYFWLMMGSLLIRIKKDAVYWNFGIPCKMLGRNCWPTSGKCCLQFWKAKACLSDKHLLPCPWDAVYTKRITFHCSYFFLDVLCSKMILDWPIYISLTMDFSWSSQNRKICHHIRRMA